MSSWYGVKLSVSARDLIKSLKETIDYINNGNKLKNKPLNLSVSAAKLRENIRKAISEINTSGKLNNTPVKLKVKLDINDAVKNLQKQLSSLTLKTGGTNINSTALSQSIKETTNSIKTEGAAVQAVNNLLREQQTLLLKSGDIKRVQTFGSAGNTITNTFLNGQQTTQTTTTDYARQQREADRAYSAYQKLDSIVNKLQADFSNLNSTKPIKDQAHIDEINVALTETRNKIKLVETASTESFARVKSDAESAVESLKLFIKTRQNEEYAASQLRAKDVPTVKAIQTNYFDELKAKINSSRVPLSELTSDLNVLQMLLNNITDRNSLTAYLNQLSITEAKFDSLSAKAKEASDFSKQIHSDLNRLNKLTSGTIFKNNENNNEVVNLRTQIQALIEKYQALQAASANSNTPEQMATNIESLRALQTELDIIVKDTNLIKENLRNTRIDSRLQTQIVNLNAQISEFMQRNGKALNVTNPLTGLTFGTELQNIKSALPNAQDVATFNELNNQFVTLRANIQNAGLTGNTFFTEITNKAKKFAQWFGVTYALTKARMYFNKLFTTVYELDTALVDLKKTFRGTDNELNQFYLDSNKLAKQLGVTTEEIIQQGAAWSRLSYSSKDAMETMAQMSSMFAAISPDMDVSAATDGLISIMKAFKIDPDNVLDGILSKVNVVGNTRATSNGEIVEMLQKSSAAMREANNTLEQTIALETAAVEITRDAASTGTAWKTISARLRSLDEETLTFSEDMAELTGKFADFTKTAKTPGGISLFTDENKTTYKSTYQIIKELSEIWDDLTDVQTARIEEVMGGKRQLQVVSAAISNFEAAENAMDSMANSAGNAEAEMEVVRESTAYAMNELKETFTSLSQNAVTSDFLKDIINSGTKFLETISDAAPVLKLLLSLFSGVAKVATGFVDTIGLLPSIMAGLSFKNIGVFRVINNDATKLTDRLTFLRKSFTDIGKDLKNGVGVKSFTSIVTAKDVNLLNDFNNVIQGGTNYTKAFNTYLSKVPISIKRQGNELIQLNNQMLKLNNSYKNGKITKQEYNTQMSTLNGRVNNVIQSTKTLTVSERIATGVTKGLGVALNLAFNIGLGIVINLLVSAIYKLINAQKEYNEKTKELAENIRQEKEEIKDLYKQYVDISKEYAVDKSKKENLIKITDDLLEKLGHEKTTIQELIDEYGNLDNAIQNITYESLKEKRGTLSNAKDVAENELKGTYKSIDKNLINNYENYIRANIGWNKFWDDIGGDFIEEYRKWYKKSFSVENVEEFIKDTNEFISRLEDSYYQDDLKKIKIYSALVTSRDDLKKSLDEYNASVDNVNKNEAEMAIALAKIDTEVPKTQEEFDSFKNSIIDTVLASDDMKKHFVGDEKEIERAITNALKEMPEYTKFFTHDLPDSTDKNTLAIKKLTDAYEELSEVLDDLFSKQDKLADLYEKIAKSTELSASEARELIELFPELTSHLVRVGSKWSFDIKGVNEAFDKLEDEFVAKAQETIDNNKKILEQSFEDYYAENTKLNLDSYLKENGIDTSDTNSLDYKAALLEYDIKLQKERNALLESYEELQANANSEIEKAIAFQQLLNNQINDFDFDVDNYNDKIKELMDSSEKMAEGESLSYDELVSLIDKFPELTYSGNNGEYYIEKSALDELIKKSYEERNARIDDEIAKTYAVNEEADNRIKAYESEKEHLENAIFENRKKFNESYDNPDLTEGILERIELDAEHTKLIKELNALDEEQYKADKALMESQSEYSEAYRKYLESLKENLTGGSSKEKNFSNELQDQIDYYKTILDAVSAVKDRYTEAIDNEIDALEESKGALKDANDERQRELDLIEARNNLENAQKRKVYVYTEGEGFKQVQDKAAVKEAEEKYRDAITEVQIAEIDKAIAEKEKQKEALENNVKDLLELEQNIQDSMAISQAMKAYGLTDPSQLLNLPDSIKNDIIGGLADSELKKDIEENKDNTKYIAVTLDDILANLGSNKTTADLSTDVLDNAKQAAYNSIVQGFSDAMQSMASDMINNTTNTFNNPNITNNNNITINDATDPQKVGEVVSEYIRDLFTKYNNSLK